MRRTTSTLGALLALTLVATPLLAQRPGQAPGMGRGMMAGGPEAMMRNPAEVVLEHREVLELTEEQVERIEGIRDAVAAENAPRWEQLKQAFGDADPREMVNSCSSGSSSRSNSAVRAIVRPAPPRRRT